MHNNFVLQARKLADRQEKESNNIHMIAMVALNNSMVAIDAAQKAKTKEEDLYQKLIGMDNNFEESMTLAKESLVLISEAKNISSIALKDAKDLVIEAKKSLPDFMINKTKGICKSSLQ